jgi:ABC-2 type transport system permease protein
VADQTLSIYARLLLAQARAQAQYPVSFAVRMVLDALVTVLEIVVVLAVFRVAPALGGFGLSDALLITGVAQLSFGLAELVVGNVDKVPDYLRTGLLDALLIRPLSVLGQLVVLEFEPRRFGRVVQAAVVFVIGLRTADVSWDPARVLLAVLVVPIGAVTFGSVFVLSAATMFWLVDASEVINALTSGGREFSLYPTTVYPAPLRWLFGYGLGLSTVAFLPTLALLNRPDPFGLPDWTHWVAPAACVPWAIAAGTLWRIGLRRYRSTGS